MRRFYAGRVRKIMRFVILMLLAALGFAAPAHADLTGTYRHTASRRIVTVEVADNGDSRFEIGGEMWRLIHRGGIDYAVYRLPGGPLVARIDDLQQFAAERGGPAPRLAISDMTLVERGETTIGRYSGRAYYLRLPDGLPSRPQMVISRDPALAAIGAAWVRQIEFSIAMLRARGAAVPDAILRIREVLATGAPVLYGGHVLESVDSRAIAPDRFVLPAEPVTLEQLREGATEALFGPTV
jgi:hypothetical protein